MFLEGGYMNFSVFIAGIPPNIHGMPVSFSDGHFWGPILIFSTGFEYILAFELPSLFICKLVFVIVGDGHSVVAAQSMLNYGDEVRIIEEVDLALFIQFPKEIMIELFHEFFLEVVVENFVLVGIET